VSASDGLVAAELSGAGPVGVTVVSVPLLSLPPFAQLIKFSDDAITNTAKKYLMFFIIYFLSVP
jgi:hypothetical protein